ncbi:MAG: hypothetical protein CM15mP84_06570 [Cellvibrionales bacterium]|nr:MAG: hypothetical protein CM15mP84_06570 [Cellvibrionales bacterium]
MFVFDSRVAVNHSLSKGVTISAMPADIPSPRLKKHQNTTEKVSHAPTVTSICRPISRHASLSVKSRWTWLRLVASSTSVHHPRATGKRGLIARHGSVGAETRWDKTG